MIIKLSQFNHCYHVDDGDGNIETV